VSGTFYRAATVPAPSGSAADNTGGSGLNANSTTFTLQRGSDNFYWNSSTSAWQSGVFNLATTHSATTSNTAVTWTSNATLPTWSAQSDGTYTVQATATDKAGNTFTGTAVTFTLDNTAPTAAITYSPSGPVKQGTTLTITATFSEPMADSPVVRFTISGANTMAATNMTKVDSTHYTGTHIVGAGDGTATVALSVGRDLAGNVITPTPTSGASFTVDNTAPTVAISAPSATITDSAAVTYTVTYADANFNSSTLAPGNITLNGTGTANASIAVTTVNATTRTVTLSSITGDGTL